MLKRILKALKLGGCFLYQFQFCSRLPYYSRVERLRKFFAYLSFGNVQYEKGDMIWRESEFIHAFWSKNLLLSELEQSSFQVIEINVQEDTLWGSAILRKPVIHPPEVQGFKE